jgi:ABC-2 type transport system ATP-binding protein
MAVVEVRHLAKRYGGTIAVQDVSFSVEEGEIFGVLGRNGAGKTTTVECLQGLRSAPTRARCASWASILATRHGGSDD